MLVLPSLIAVVATPALAMDRDRGAPRRGFIRLEQDSQDGVNWKDRLCLLLEGIGEVCYNRM